MVSGKLALLFLVIAVALIIICTAKLKINAFIVLIGVAYLYALMIGMEPIEIMEVIRNGFGGLLTTFALIILCGTIMGKILEKTGAAVSLARFILKLVKKKNSPLAMTLSGFIVSIPVTCDSGFIILNPINKGLSHDTGISMVVMTLALSSGLYATHTLVPPTAGPLAVAGELGANLAQVILFGLIVSLGACMVALLWATRYGKKTDLKPINAVSYDEVIKKLGRIPNVGHAVLPILYPILIICLASIANMPSHPFGESMIVEIIRVLGNPSLALFMSMLLALTLVPKQSLKEAWSSWIGEGMNEAAVIMSVTAAGGAFGAVLKASPMVDFISENMATANLGVFLPFIITAVLKCAQGSTTVAMLTTTGIIAPLISQLGISPVICMLAIGSGGMICSHTNDSYFWVVSQFSGMDVDVALKNFTTMTAIMGVTAFAITYGLSFII